jgi:membrane-associated protease RseP (regulator of RpoE activity)
MQTNESSTRSSIKLTSYVLFKWVIKLVREIFQKFTHQPLLNVVLLLVTLFTTYAAQGPWYSLAVVTLLFAHEMGHYLMCRHYHIQATLPFFIPIPAPFNPFGTMGAVIKMEGKIPNRQALFDVGIAGPLAGLFFTLIALVVGLSLPNPVASGAEEGIKLGVSLLFLGLAKLLNPELFSNPEAILHPVAFAGWVGLFVTALNLLPIGQLDGGHVVYAIFGSKSKYIYRAALIGFGLNTAFYPPWIIFFILLVTFGLKHPPPLDDSEPVDLKRKILAGFTFIIFVLAFIPFPFDIF